MRFLSRISLAFIILNVLVILTSWMISAVMPALGINSLLSYAGIRWFFGCFSDNLSSEILVWLLLLGIGGQVFISSNIINVFKGINPVGYKQRLAISASLVICGIILLSVFLLVLKPHAMLLSITGALFPSPFSYALIPIVSFSLLSIGATYGLIAEVYTGFHDIFKSMVRGVNHIAPVIVAYIFTAQFYYSVKYVLSNIL